MSEKRFHLDMDIVPYSIVDLSDGESYPIGDDGIFETVVGLLNGQQATITKQNKIIKEQNLRIYCQDKEIQKLLNDLEGSKYESNIR